jgi:dGTPase
MATYDQELIDFAQQQEEKVENFNDRHYVYSDDHRGNNRDEYRRDYARVLYSSSFRRLQGKMQLLGIDPTHFYRNRLTHSLEVAQIAGGIARDLHLKDPVVAETCSLAHDLGNPPFGHAGEKILHDLAIDIGGYEGNAQAFRILHRLEKKHSQYPGLNLTLRSLFGITKYFYKKDDNPDKPHKFLYDDDYEFLVQQMDQKQKYIKKSIDAQVMDLADEIAYAAHDLEDALRFGFLTLQEMMYEFYISKNFQGASDKFDELATKARNVALKANLLDTSEEYSFILRKELTSNIVHELINDISLVDCKDNLKKIGYKNLQQLSQGLKNLVFKAVLRKKDVQLYEKQGERIIRGLFEVYTDSNFNKELLLLPPELRAIANQTEASKKEIMQKRVVIDYISGMMDSFAIKEYQRYFGTSSLDILYDRNT